MGSEWQTGCLFIGPLAGSEAGRDALQSVDSTPPPPPPADHRSPAEPPAEKG